MSNQLTPKILVLPSFYPMQQDYPRGSFFEEQTRLIKKNGIDISVVFNENRSIISFRPWKIKTAHFQVEDKFEDNVHVMRRKSWNIVPTKFSLGRRIWIFLSLQLIKRYIVQYGKPDLIHVHCVFDAGIVAKNLKKKYKIPYIITEHTSSFALGNLSDRQLTEAVLAYKEACKVIVVSKSFEELLLKKTEFGKIKVEVVPNFIDSDFFNSDNYTSSKTGFKDYIFTVCYHENNKKIDRLIEAFQLIHDQYPNLKLIIGGEGSRTAYLKSRAKESGIGDKIIFVGILSKVEVRDYLKNARLFVLPSDFETFGVVLIEAMSMGVPVVATDSGGPRDIITPNTGVIVKRTVEDLKDGIQKVLNNYEKYNKAEIRQHVLANFNGDVIANKYIEIYKSVISENEK
jgi:L-malate glycosyltransferase